MTTAIDGLKAKLVELQQQHANGTVTQAQFAEQNAALERQILELVLAGASVAAASPQSSETAALPPTEAKASLSMLLALTIGVLVIAAAGYAWNSSVAANQRQAIERQMAAANADPATQNPSAEQIAAMTEKMLERLAQSPDDVEGWTMLGRAYSVIGRHADALKAYQTASNLRKDDPSLLADYADSMAVNNGSSLEGEPIKLVERALKLDPQNLKALYLAGAYDFDRKDYLGAVQRWEKLVASASPDNGFVGQVQVAIDEARKLAALKAAGAPSDAAPARAAAATDASVSGTVTISAALAQQARPDDTVFVFARAAEGSRMPLAILRKQVRDLPITFNLNDSMAMSPATALSSQSQVIVGARVSKSGNAMVQPGDLQGQSAPVKVGSSGLTIEIKELAK